MLFCGDISLPYERAIELKEFPEKFKQEIWFGNLEGSLVKKEDSSYESLIQNPKVFNSYDAVKQLLNDIPFKSFNLANNHLQDAAPASVTINNIHDLGIECVGAGKNIVFSSKSIVLNDTDGVKYRIFAFGWDCINCIYSTKKKQGVNPYIRKHVLDSVKLHLNADEKALCFFHWNYELELYPQPFDRQIAMDLIDLGVEAVIGCHAHRVQPIEFYKGKPIVYGLGNFLFKQGTYCNNRLVFPECSNEELVFEIKNGKFFIHLFEYNRKESKLLFITSSEIGPNENFKHKASFSGFNHKDYECFFKKNRIQRKLLPIFYTTENILGFFMKSKWIKLRGWVIDILVSVGFKNFSRIKNKKL